MGAWGAFVGVALPLVSIAVSLTLGVWLLGRFSAVTLVQAGFAMASAAAILLWVLWGQGPAMATAALLLGASLGIVQGASFASIPQLNRAPQDRARAAGAIAQLGNLGTVTGTPLLALLIHGAGVTGLSLFLLSFSLLGLLIVRVQALRRAASGLRPG
jgi:predicted MFS family arabinose efflux permease